MKLLLGAIKVSAMYKEGPDIHWPLFDIDVEVKRRKAGAFALDYRWLESAQMLLKRADREEWLVTLKLDTLLDMLEIEEPGD